MASTKKYFLLLILTCTVSFNSCKKANNQSGAPSAYVDIYIDTTQPSYSNLNAVGGWVYLYGGVRGIIVYRKTISDFMAYERNCPYQPNNACALVKVDAGAITATDTCCGSKFLMTDGSVYNPPATLPLTSYQTSFDGVTLHIFN